MNENQENQKQQNKENPSEGKSPKELTPQQILQRRKMIVFPLMLLAFVGVMWLIFAPTEKPEEQSQAGLNTDLPTPEQNAIVSDKRDAYEQQEMQIKRDAKMRSLEDIAFSLEGTVESDQQRAEREEQELRMAPKPVEYYENPAQFENYNSNSALHSSIGAYQDLNTQLGSFYEQDTSQPSEQETKLLSRIEQLEEQLQQQQEQRSIEEQQLDLIEKSYRLATQYMSGDQKNGIKDSTISTSRNGKAVVQPVRQVRQEVVSLLAAPMPDSVFIREFSQPRNMGFHTAAGSEYMTQKNSINACVYRTMTVTDGQEVPFRLMESMMAGDVLIPANTILTGTTRIDGERMSITINAVQHEGNVIPIELTVYDMDGGAGISVPSSEEINAVKEIAANAGSGLGSSITITDDAGTQLLSDLGRSVIQGTAQYIGQKMRQVKVTLKAGYRVLLLPPLK